ncbi:TetR/AcrR family transcriptional regulator [Pediococcus claussenii]|uniref:Transcriptional regulator, TetR family n=1 Tax=Pediococcus claussenii (strain ATCC BAA-344 / DSM 14800 / JCM 18046 / KCTC 3811 / LMG 21948 / P06) TaxID=701521 RepID=G8PDU8_PEDCP|nr:TetR/AcrR family transcriptional regulator [Pediococcus claussenii]AEV95433.1 Transcriptional regulator, TetR family [Pediococcus claussenii ATCC BAA-344]ANZ68962.1 hypothetical protein AYR57_00875 [Pediococcus claussenii]ANZ70778.1 hypothetical protein AYR58_00875 [Pediococcus claussenii]KRN19075.1 hypothetical protein IV79_GL001737 [Pediococcus claussenii]
MARKTEFDVDSVLKGLMLFFWENDFEATTMRKVAEFVHVKPQSLYNKFGNKEELYIVALGYYTRLFKRTLQVIEKQNKAKNEILCDLLVMDWENDVFPRGCMAVDAVGTREYRSVTGMVDNIFNEYRKSIQRVISKDSAASKDNLVGLLLTFHNGLQVEAKSCSRSALYEKAVEFIKVLDRG